MRPLTSCVVVQTLTYTVGTIWLRHPINAASDVLFGITDGNVYSGDNMLLELEDVAQLYKRPSIIDIKVRSCGALFLTL